MTRNIEVLDSNNTIQEAAEKMKELDVGYMPVAVGKEVVGMITDRDVVVRVVSKGIIPEEARVIDGMSQELLACAEDDDIETAAKSMGKHKVRRLVVMDSDRNLAGVVSLRDMALNLDPQRAGKMLAQISR
jgi:CBS domain-containing protein